MVVLRHLFHVELPCVLGGKNVKIGIDVVDSNIPMLLSKGAMKEANTVVNFSKDTIKLFGTTQIQDTIVYS